MTRLMLPALLLVVAACGSGHTEGGLRPDPGERLEGTTYVVTTVTVKGEPHALVKGSEIRLRFDGGRLTITAGCNTMSGAYQFLDSRLTVDSLASTEMGCAAPLMAQDTWIAGLFDGPVQLTTGNDAALISGDVVLALADREVVSPDLSLQGTHWVLDTIIEGDAASSLPAGAAAWLQINGSTVALNDSCNAGSGAVRVVGDALTFSAIRSTKKACAGTSEVQRAFAAVLDGPTTFEIDEQTLRITNGDRGLGFHGVQATR